MNEGKPGGKNEMPRNAKTRIWRVRFCPPEHMNMLSGRTRTSHPGEQGQVTRENNSGYHGRRFWAPKEVIRGLVQDHPLMLVGQ